MENRIIKFRGKRKDDGEWVYGGFMQTPEALFIVDYSTVVQKAKGGYPTVYDVVEVYPETVGQFTGLFDKNGKEIYEGDIVDGDWEVRRWSEEAKFVLCNPIGEQNINICAKEEFTKLSMADSEIIGDIYSDPELVGERK